MKMTHQEIKNWAQQRNTSIEIATVILSHSHTLDDAQRLWVNPTRSEGELIQTIAFSNTQKDVLYWRATELIRNG